MISPAISNEKMIMHIERNTCATVIWHRHDALYRTQLHITVAKML